MLFLKKISFWLALIGTLSATLLMLKLRASINEPVPAPPIAPPAKPFARGIGASGLIESRRENTAVGVPLGGLVTQVKAEVWARVKAGDVLLQLDDRDLRASLLTQRAQVDVAEAQLAKVNDQLTRLRSVSDVRAITADDLKNRENDQLVARAQVAAARATVAQTEALLDRLTVRAPIDGTILQVNIRAGEYASPSAATPPIVLGDVDEVQVRVDVDEQVAPRVKAGRRAVGYIKGSPGEPIEMTFVRIEPFVIPKRSLTGASIERVDTRVLQVIYRFPPRADRPVYVGQQIDLFIEE